MGSTILPKLPPQPRPESTLLHENDMHGTPPNTDHTQRRAQQRCIPPLINEWLDRFGEESHDGRGAVIRYFSKRSRRTMERQIGREPVHRLADKLHAYRVEDASTGSILTCGYRTKPIRR